MEIGFDLISDFNFDTVENFNWQGKATSLYCLIAGNVSKNSKTTLHVLNEFSTNYHGVFYVPGPLEFINKTSISDYNELLNASLQKLNNVVLLHHNVIVIDKIAIVGVTGWAGNVPLELNDKEVLEAGYNDLLYLHSTIQKLQKHIDVKTIIIVTNSVPNRELYYKEEPDIVYHQLPLVSALSGDTEGKVKYWVFGNHDKLIDTKIETISYYNNPYLNRDPYYPKRISITD